MSTEQWAVFLYLLALLPLLGLGYLRRRPKPAADQPRQEGADPEAEPFLPRSSSRRRCCRFPRRWSWVQPDRSAWTQPCARRSGNPGRVYTGDAP